MPSQPSSILFNKQSILECAICLSTMILPITLSCGHTFCEPCIKHKNFKFSKKVCPICRCKLILRPNHFSVNLALNEILLHHYGNEKTYKERQLNARKILYPHGFKQLEHIKRYFRENLPWIIIVILLIHLLRLHIRMFNFSLEKYKAKALNIAQSIKGENSLDFKYLLFSQFLRLLFSNII